MEEILSSIKRIISEDGEVAPAAPARRSPVRGRDDPDVLELTDALHEPMSLEKVGIEDAGEHPAVAPRPAATDSLLSATSAETTRQALASLSQLVVRTDPPAVDNTLEGLVRELLRPLLKEWLDANLPRIVQATVDREVARLSGGA